MQQILTLIQKKVHLLNTIFLKLSSRQRIKATKDVCCATSDANLQALDGYIRVSKGKKRKIAQANVWSIFWLSQRQSRFQPGENYIPWYETQKAFKTFRFRTRAIEAEIFIIDYVSEKTNKKTHRIEQPHNDIFMANLNQIDQEMHSHYSSVMKQLMSHSSSAIDL